MIWYICFYPICIMVDFCDENGQNNNVVLFVGKKKDNWTQNCGFNLVF